MKKQHFKLSLIGGMLIAMSASVNAQWTETGSAVYLTNGTKNVGIGTTTPAFALDLIRSGSANLSLKSTTGTSNLLLDRANSSATSSVSYRTNGVGTWQTGTVGNDNFNIRNIGLGNTAMSISAANNYVGLGVGTPLIVLDTKAGQTIGTTATTGTYHAAGNQGEKVSFGYVPSNAAGEFVGMKAVVNPGTNFCGNSGDILFNTWECNTSTSRPVMAINGTGNVGIGTTTPQGKLHINGGDLVLDNSNQRFFENGNPTWDISGGSSNYAIGRSGIDYPFVIDYATANVGIGTTTPAYLLDVQGKVGIFAGLNGDPTIKGLGSSSWTRVGGNGGGLALWGNNAADLDNAPHCYISDLGNVGIGTTTPASKLDVNGDAKINGGATIDGSVALCNSLDASQGNVGIGGAVYTNVKLFIEANTDWGVYIEAPLSPVAALEINGTAAKPGGGSWVAASDARLKDQVVKYEDGLAELLKINPVKFHYNSTSGFNTEKEYIGVIAQELKEVAPYMVNKSKIKANNQEYYNVDNSAMTYMLINAVKELAKQNEVKDAKNMELQNQLNDMQQCVQSLCENQNSAAQKASSVEPQALGNLFQNTPNPFNQTTVIRYALNSENTSGKIIIRDLNGNLVKQVNIANGGKGQVTINANELAAGTYTYTLEIAGASVDTKLMVVTK